MALSNIWREPRREITETLLGLLIIGPAIWADYKFAVWFNGWTDPKDPCPVILGLLLGIFAPIMLILIFAGIASLAHGIGEGITDFLARHGLELRPKRRYN